MDRRIAGDEAWREKFKALGLSEKFDLIGREWSSDHGRMVHVKCKSCGEQFLTYGFSDLLKGRTKHLICIKCGYASDGRDVWERSSKCTEAMQYYIAGHSVKETAEKFGVSVHKINNSVKLRHLTNGLPLFGKNCKSDRALVISEGEHKLCKILSQKGFNYLEGYENRHSRVRIRCRSCGAEFERTVDFLIKGHAVCKECQKREAKRRHEEQAEIKRLTDEIHRLWNPPRPPKNAYAEQHERFLSRSGICEVCGNAYTVREYARSCGLKYARDNGVCSAKCRDEKKRRKLREAHKDRQDSHRHRAKKFGCEYDSSVKLDKLIKRDGLRCAICGGMCDLNDHTWTEYAGPFYPSIDHIIPMSKGGGHVWDNVQVAHIICNSEKGDRLEVTV